jgi:hypothetical protein
MRPPRGWEKFSGGYVSDLGYWYIPKGMTIKEGNVDIIKKRLRVLKDFEGEDWSEIQKRYTRILARKGLFKRRVEGQDEINKAAIGRMFKVVVSSLGLAWINRNNKIALTEAGGAFIRSRKPLKISDQVNRYQFCNPTVKKGPFLSFRLLPLPFLVHVLLGLNNKALT